MPGLTLPEITGPPRRRFEIFSLEPPRVSQAAVRDLAGQMRMREIGDGRTVRFDRTKITQQVGSELLTVYRASGAFRYVDRARWQVDDGMSEVGYADEEAIEFAWRQIRRLRLATRREARPVKVTHLRVG